MDKIELKALLNERFGEMSRLFLLGDIAGANAILNELVEELGDG